MNYRRITRELIAEVRRLNAHIEMRNRAQERESARQAERAQRQADDDDYADLQASRATYAAEQRRSAYEDLVHARNYNDLRGEERALERLRRYT